MVERWSSKPYVWVRFLLLLVIFNVNSSLQIKNRFTYSWKKKHSIKSLYRTIKKQYRYNRRINRLKHPRPLTKLRSFFRGVNVFMPRKSVNFFLKVRQKNVLTYSKGLHVSYVSIRSPNSLNSVRVQNLTNLLQLFKQNPSSLMKSFNVNSFSLFHQTLLISSSQQDLFVDSKYLSNGISALSFSAFSFYKPGSSKFSWLNKVLRFPILSSSKSYFTLPIVRSKISNLKREALLSLYFIHQSKVFLISEDTGDRFFPKGVMEIWSKNFYVLNRSTRSVSTDGATLKLNALPQPLNTSGSVLDSLILSENFLENMTSSSISFTQSSERANSRRITYLSILPKILKRRLRTRKLALVTRKSAAHHLLATAKIKKKLTKIFELIAPVYELSTPSPLILVESSFVEQYGSNVLGRLFFKNANLASYVFKFSLLFKYFFVLHPSLVTSNTSVLLLNISNSRSLLSSNILTRSNVLPFHTFNYSLRRRVLKAFTYDTFSPNVTMWYYNTIIRFIEHCSGKKVYLKLNPFIENSLTFKDLARSAIWAQRIVGFQKTLGPRMFLHESLKIMHVAIRYRDPTFLSNWIRAMLKRTNFYKFRPLFRYMRYVFTNLFQVYFPELGFKGIKLKLKGKISVAGNARTRTLFYRVGQTSHSTFDNRVVYDLSYVNTFTGVLGFQLWFYY